MRFLYAGILIFWLLAGCASTPGTPPGPVRSSVPPVVEGRLPTDYTFIQASAPKRPEWIDTEPDDADGTHFLVGMSKYHATERDSREEAMRAAREEFAKYTGVEVSAVNEVVRSLYGSASEILDATIAGNARATEKTDAQVSRIKAWHWYWEKSRGSRGGIDQGVAYQAWVLVTVPVSEYARVQEWKANKAKEEKNRLLALKEAAERERKQLLEDHLRRLEVVDRALGEGDIVRFLSLLDAEFNRLGSLADERQANGGSFIDTAQELRRVQKDLLSRAEEIGSALHLDTGIYGSTCFSLPGGENKISVWGWLKGNKGNLPVPGLPLRLETAAGTVARTATDNNGRADFSQAKLPAGIYRLVVDVDTTALRNLSESFRLPLVKVESRLAIAELQADLDGVIRGLVARLFAGSSMAPPLARKVILGPVTYGEAGPGSEFAFLLKRLLSERLTQISGLEVITPRARGVEEVARAAATRGITAGPQPALGAGATQAIIDGADAALESIYAVTGGEVTITLALKAAGSDRLLAAASAAVRREMIPGGVELIPAKGDGVTPPVDLAAGIRLEITSHLGDGQTYGDGDSISYFVRTDRDAYLLLIYEDAAKNLIRILPNRYAGKGLYRAGSTLQVPAPGDRFEFIITPPFGQERVWAFAASTPFPSLPGDELENGLLLLKGSLSDIFASVRAASKGGGAYGEARTAITTVSRESALQVRR